MKFVVPTLACKGLVANAFKANGREYAVGEIVDLAYGDALVLKAVGLITGLVGEDDKHLEAVQHMAVYGADGWFPLPKQTSARIGDYLNAIERGETQQ